MWAQATPLIFRFLLVGANHFQPNGNAEQRMQYIPKNETEPLSIFEKAANFITKIRKVFDDNRIDEYTTHNVMSELMVDRSEFEFPPCEIPDIYILQFTFLRRFYWRAYHVETTHITHACQYHWNVIQFVAEFRNESSSEAPLFMGFTLDETKGLLIGAELSMCDKRPWNCEVIKNPIPSQ